MNIEQEAMESFTFPNKIDEMHQKIKIFVMGTILGEIACSDETMILDMRDISTWKLDNFTHQEKKFFASMHKVWVKWMVLENTGENHRV